MDLPDDAETSDVDITVQPITAKLVNAQAQARTSSATPAGDAAGAGKPGEYRYRIGVGDVIELRIPSLATFGTPSSATAPGLIAERDAGYVVAPDGTIVVPFVGPVTVGNTTLREAQERVVQGLSRFIKNPQVNVSVSAFRSQKILVGGQVPKPGFLPVTDVPLTLIAALTEAGSTPQLRGDRVPRPLSGAAQQSAQVESPDYTRVELVRGGSRQTYNVLELLRSGDRLRDPLLRDGDSVYVPPVAREYVFVLGEIKQPTLLEIARGQASLAEVLMASGGVNQQTAKADRVYVIRGQLEKPDVFQLNANAADAMLLADAFQLEPRDVVYVAEANISRWNRFLSQLLPTLQALITGTVVDNALSK